MKKKVHLCDDCNANNDRCQTILDTFSPEKWMIADASHPCIGCELQQMWEDDLLDSGLATQDFLTESAAAFARELRGEGTDGEGSGE